MKEWKDTRMDPIESIKENRSSRCDIEDLLRFNHRLDACSVSELNETFIQSKLAELQSMDFTGCLRWLTFARIGELALFCAGNCADAGEFEACGDLMFNPRRIAIHINGRPQPVIKPRHMTFSETLELNGLKPAMRDAYFLVIEKPPLLPSILEKLKESSLFSCQYLQSVSDRMCRVADTIGFLSAYHFSNSRHFCRKLQQASDAERHYVLSRRCNFNLETFHNLGRDIEETVALSGLRSRFLKPMMTEPTQLPDALNLHRGESESKHSASGLWKNRIFS